MRLGWESEPLGPGGRILLQACSWEPPTAASLGDGVDDLVCPPVLNRSFSLVPSYPRAHPPNPDCHPLVIQPGRLVRCQPGVRGSNGHRERDRRDRDLVEPAERALGPACSSGNLSLSLLLSQLRGHDLTLMSATPSTRRMHLTLPSICPWRGEGVRGPPGRAGREGTCVPVGDSGNVRGRGAVLRCSLGSDPEARACPHPRSCLHTRRSRTWTAPGDRRDLQDLPVGLARGRPLPSIREPGRLTYRQNPGRGGEDLKRKD